MAKHHIRRVNPTKAELQGSLSEKGSQRDNGTDKADIKITPSHSLGKGNGKDQIRQHAFNNGGGSIAFFRFDSTEILAFGGIYNLDLINGNTNFFGKFFSSNGGVAVLVKSYSGRRTGNSRYFSLLHIGHIFYHKGKTAGRSKCLCISMLNPIFCKGFEHALFKGIKGRYNISGRNLFHTDFD